MGISYADLFSGNIRAARARANLRLSDVAKRMNVLGHANWNDSKVSKAERGKVPVTASELLALSISLQCTLLDLVGGSTPPDLLVSFPDARYEMAGVAVRNSAYGYQDYSVRWDEGSDYPVIIRPANSHSAFAQDRSVTIARGGHPRHIGRRSDGDKYIRSQLAG